LRTYSQRLPWSSSPNPLTVLRRTKELAREPVNDLTSSNPLVAAFDYPHQRLREIFASIPDFSYHPAPFGEAASRSAIAAYYERHGASVQPEQLALTASTSEAYAVLFKLLCDPGDEILVPTPSYPLFDYLASLESVRVIPYRLLYAGNWLVDFDHLRAGISDRTRAIVIVTPNNPTGSFLKAGEHASLLELANDRGLPLICDEVFMDYPILPATDVVRTFAGSETGLSFSLNGLSKTSGMPQLKLAWIVINGDAEERSKTAERLEQILDTYLSVGTPVQRVLPELLTVGLEIQEQIRSRINMNFLMLVNKLSGSPVHPLHVEGGWSAILQLPITRSEEYWTTTLLRDYGVAVQPGYFFDIATEAFAVISLLTPSEQLSTGLDKLLALIRKG
jgi:alanine-synthesizing transaminase